METKNRLVQTFIDLVSIDSESKDEKQVHEYLKNVFTSLNLEIVEDDSMAKTGLGANNLIAKLRGSKNTEPLFFSSHTDTVSPGKGIEVIEKDGILYSKGDTILAADNKAGIAIMIEAIRRIQEEKIPTGLLEFVLSPGEEIGLIGAAALDMSLLTSTYGFVLDSDGPVGHVTIASPFLHMYDVKIIGRAAHAGMEPEKGISAVSILAEALSHIETGRLDAETTANIGFIQGGEASNIVMDELLLKGEVRAISEKRAQQLVQQMETSFKQAADKFGGKVEISANQMATGFRITDDEPVMELLKESTTHLGFDLVSEISGGGSDANIFNAQGKSTPNLSIGYANMHTTQESVSIAEMEKAVTLVIELAKRTPAKRR
ncbi:M20/M25/M40 family metallo-hydrolase [Vagococcus elongatus]|uniref:Peptidase M20 dimerisation domain-containing protein n=1 Tax=Vagococcus elongatus TaxID=180344 RepID=A0A430B121_9ENTE|nr:M20/M25/M40 family metallo-hydrolase [Vagococcus elongatus]RSU14015.1 hypothetical protein CBF29_03790 [Vagococcus elongatus]